MTRGTYDQQGEARIMNEEVIEALATATVSVLKDIVGPLKAHNAELETRIKHLEARPLQKWAGVHMAGVPYSEASLVTRHGSLWVATATTTTTPGTAGSDWRLIVKKGSAT